MRWSPFCFLALALLALTGCGTFNNLQDSPNGLMFIGTGCCYPFGGVVRSGLLAFWGTLGGLDGLINGDIAISQGEFGPGFQQIGDSMGWTSICLGALADMPLSLAGDILTLPVVYARSHEYWWATWWGKESMPMPERQFAPAPEEGNKKLDAEIEPSDASPKDRPAVDLRPPVAGPAD
jgi:hypothetical protein